VGEGRITLRRPDDWHLHLRDGAMLAAVLPFTAARFARAIVMPNLVPPVTTAAAAAAYRRRILGALPEGARFEPLMTCYLTDGTDPDELDAGRRDGTWVAAKLYPAHATTNSAHGVSDVRAVRRCLERMERIGMPLLVHGEVTDPEVDVFDREAVFLERVLSPLLREHEGLKVVLEHVTTAAGVAFVEGGRERVAGTITVQHLMLNRNAMLVGGIRPHLYCLPILKTEADRRALRRAATSGSPRFFLGTGQRAARGLGQGVRLRLRRLLHRPGGARALRPGVRGGGCARPARGLRQPERPAVLRPSTERGTGDAGARALARAGRGAGGRRGPGGAAVHGGRGGRLANGVTGSRSARP
jgi:dihydroorotase